MHKVQGGADSVLPFSNIDIKYRDVSFSLYVNGSKTINLDSYVQNAKLIGTLMTSFSNPGTPATHRFTSSINGNSVIFNYVSDGDSGFSASIALRLYYILK